MSYTEYLPSKKFIQAIGTIILGTLLIIGLYYGVGALSKEIKKEQALANPVIDPVVKDVFAQDHDQDGLPDWEEVLWKMDPDNPDTDGDGILDGVEVAPERNAILQGGGNGDAEGSLTPNETEEFIRELLITATALGQAGEVTDSGADQVAAPAIESLSKIQIGAAYGLKDIHVTKTLTSKAIADYTKVVNDILTNAPVAKENGLAVAMGALKDNDPKPLKKLDIFKKQYDQIIATLRKVPVPQAFVGVHVHLLNDFAFFSGSMSALQNVFDNPAQSLAVVLQYESKLTGYQKDLENYQKLVIQVLGGE
jgi:hypothetical protein